MDKKTEIKKLLNSNKCQIIKFSNNDVEYIDNKGYKYRKNIYNKNFAQNIKEHKYDIKNPYCIDNINLTLGFNNSYKTTICEFNGGSKISVFKCGRCNQEFKGLIGNVLKYKYKICSKCVREVQDTKLKDYEDLKKEVEKCGFKLLSKKWNGYSERINVEDQEGFKGKAKFSTIKNGGSFNKFSIYNPFSLENLSHYCKINGLDCSVVIPQQYNGYENVKFKCMCGKIFITSTDKFLNGKNRCNDCSNRMSNIEFKVESFLIDNNLNYVKQKKFKDCYYKKVLPFDFYLEEYNLLIEVQGQQHYEPLDYFGRDKGFTLQQKRDTIKRNYCIYHNINLLELPYWEFDNDNYIDILKKYLT